MTSNWIKWQSHLEDVRHNQAMEAETKRANMEKEAETWRSNLAQEKLKSASNVETERHNKETERVADTTQAYQQYASLADVQERNRHNEATEMNTLLGLQEEARHNYVSENLNQYSLDNTRAYQQRQIGLGYSQLNELNRHQLAVESENERHNVEMENLDWYGSTVKANKWIPLFFGLGGYGLREIMQTGDWSRGVGLLSNVYSNQ